METELTSIVSKVPQNVRPRTGCEQQQQQQWQRRQYKQITVVYCLDV